jgi:hypothetical protein
MIVAGNDTSLFFCVLAVLCMCGVLWNCRNHLLKESPSRLILIQTGVQLIYSLNYLYLKCSSSHLSSSSLAAYLNSQPSTHRVIKEEKSYVLIINFTAPLHHNQHRDLITLFRCIHTVSFVTQQANKNLHLLPNTINQKSSSQNNEQMDSH